jgi:cytochrome c-type biogenesis protein CcmH/NrfG
MTRWQKYGAAANKATENAIKLDPTNPRIALYTAQSAYYRPENFGGGKKVALPLAEKAIALFKTFKPANTLMPNWGAEMAEQLALQCKE